MVVSPEAEAAWKSIQIVLRQQAQAEECFGIAPKSNIERRLEATLRRLRVFGDRE
jgi:hypothetical protein